MKITVKVTFIKIHLKQKHWQLELSYFAQLYGEQSGTCLPVHHLLLGESIHSITWQILLLPTVSFSLQLLCSFTLKNHSHQCNLLPRQGPTSCINEPVFSVRKLSSASDSTYICCVQLGRSYNETFTVPHKTLTLSLWQLAAKPHETVVWPMVKSLPLNGGEGTILHLRLSPDVQPEEQHVKAYSSGWLSHGLTESSLPLVLWICEPAGWQGKLWKILFYNRITIFWSCKLLPKVSVLLFTWSFGSVLLNDSELWNWKGTPIDSRS